MTRFSGVHEQSAPGGSDVVGDVLFAIRIVSTGDDGRRKRKWVGRIGPEGHQVFGAYLRIGNIRRCDKESTGYLPLEQGMA